METKKMLTLAQEKTGVGFIGLIRKTARIKHGIGSSISDVLGWDVIMRADNGTCYEYYVAQPPLIGMTQPQPTTCPLGLVAFNGFKIDIEKAIEIFHSQNGGDSFTHVTISWPLVFPAAMEPFWYFRTNLGVEVIIGANTGKISNSHPIAVHDMATAE